MNHYFRGNGNLRHRSVATVGMKSLPALLVNRVIRPGGITSARWHPRLLGLLAVAVHWSTALTEVAAAALIFSFLFSLRNLRNFPGEEPGVAITTVRRLRLLLILWGVYIIAVCVSLSLSGELLSSNARALWHPFLFVVMILTPLGLSDVKRVGLLYLLGGVSAAVALPLINLAAGYQTPAVVFTGLTTFADQIALLVILAVSATAFQRHRTVHVVGMAAAGIFLMVVLFWTAERAPVALLAVAGTVLVAISRPRLLVFWGALTIGLFFLAPSGLRAKSDWVVRGNPVDRYVVWEEGVRQLARAPLFGAGPDSFTRLLPPEARGRFANRAPSSWHNDLLQTTLDSGPVAAATLAVLLFLAAVAAFRVAWGSRAGPDFARAIPGILFLSLTALGFVGSVVSTAILGSTYWTLMGLALRAWAFPATHSPAEQSRVTASDTSA